MFHYVSFPCGHHITIHLRTNAPQGGMAGGGGEEKGNIRRRNSDSRSATRKSPRWSRLHNLIAPRRLVACCIHRRHAIGVPSTRHYTQVAIRRHRHKLRVEASPDRSRLTVQFAPIDPVSSHAWLQVRFPGEVDRSPLRLFAGLHLSRARKPWNSNQPQRSLWWKHVLHLHRNLGRRHAAHLQPLPAQHHAANPLGRIAIRVIDLRRAINRPASIHRAGASGASPEARLQRLLRRTWQSALVCRARIRFSCRCR